MTKIRNKKDVTLKSAEQFCIYYFQLKVIKYLNYSALGAAAGKLVSHFGPSEGLSLSPSCAATLTGSPFWKENVKTCFFQIKAYKVFSLILFSGVHSSMRQNNQVHGNLLWLKLSFENISRLVLDGLNVDQVIRSLRWILEVETRKGGIME